MDKIIKKGITVVVTLAMFASAEFAQAQIVVPLPSPQGSVSSVIGLTEVQISYYRPKAKGRQIFGDGSGYLVPYGKIWRTGANSGTKVSFSDDVKVQGSPVPKGQYLIFTWPGPSEWAVSLYKDLSIGGNTGKYDRSNEVISFKVQPENLTEKVETFTVGITDIAPDNEHANIQLTWEHTSVKFSVDVDYDSRVMAAIEATNMNEHPDSYMVAANYYYDRKRHLDQALVWVNKYLELEGKGKEFFNIYLKAEIQRSLYDKKGALITARKALDIAKKAPNDFGYIKLIEEIIGTLK